MTLLVEMSVVSYYTTLQVPSANYSTCDSIVAGSSLNQRGDDNFYAGVLGNFLYRKGKPVDRAIFLGKPQQNGATFTGISPFDVPLKITLGGRLPDSSIVTTLKLACLGNLKPPMHKLGDLFRLEERGVSIVRIVNDVTFINGEWNYQCEWEIPPDDNQPASLQHTVNYKEGELTSKRKVKR